jgi:sugar phosphate isomerase/epimerase
MLRAISSYVNVRDRLHPGLLDGYARAGAEAVEIFAAKGHFNYSDRAHVRELAGWFKDSGVKLNSLHSPMFRDEHWNAHMSEPINFIDPDKRQRFEALDEIKRALEVAEILPFNFLVQHIGNSNEYFDEHKFDHAMTAIEHLRAFAKPLGVTVLVENIPNELSTPEKLMELLQTAHFQDVGVCFDLGHAHMMSRVHQAFEVLKDRIRSTHVHDNDAAQDSHLLPGDGTIDWSEAMSLLHSAPQAPAMLMELDGERAGDIVKSAAAAFSRLEAAVTAAK